MTRIGLIVLLLVAAGCMTQPNRPPQITSAAGLVYPPDAKAQHVEGYVVVSYQVTVDGSVANAQVVESVPPGVFDDAALTAVRAWRFLPAVKHGEAVEAHLTSNVGFKLGESEAYVR